LAILVRSFNGNASLVKLKFTQALGAYFSIGGKKRLRHLLRITEQVTINVFRASRSTCDLSNNTKKNVS